MRRERRSILDFTGRQLESFATRVGAEDRPRIEQHLEATRQIERQLDALSASCMPTTRPEAGLDYTRQFGNELLPLVIRTQLDMMVAAMACDMTRVGTMLLSNSHNNQYVFPWLVDRDPSFGEEIGPEDETAGGPQEGLRHHHSMAHSDGRSEAHRRRKNFVDQWFVEQFAYLVGKLAATEDVGGGRMLDNTMVLHVNLQRTGGGHQTNDLMWLMAGNADGAFRTGRYLRYAGGTNEQTVPANRLFTSICQAMGMETDYFGDRGYGGALTTLR